MNTSMMSPTNPSNLAIMHFWKVPRLLQKPKSFLL
jgi:hypothetical protein